MQLRSGPAVVSALRQRGGGLVVAAGAALHMLRPGSQRLRSRALPPDLEVIAVAAEPWSPYRLAIASPAAVGIYTGHQPHGSVRTAQPMSVSLAAHGMNAGAVRDDASVTFEVAAKVTRP